MARPSPACAILIGLAASALALAACSKGNNSPLTSPTVAPTVTPSVGPSATPAASTVGVAYLPDAGDGGPAGITVMHFLTAGNTSYPYTPQLVNFASPVLLYQPDVNGTVALTSLKSAQGGFSLIQGVLGVATANIFPGGAFYNTFYPPPSPSPPPAGAELPTVSSEAIIGNTDNAVGLLVGPQGSGILGINQASSQTPTFNGYIAFSSGCTGHSGVVKVRTAIVASPTVNSSGDYTVLVRGPSDIVSYQVAPNFNVSPPQYTFCPQKEDDTLGAGILSTPGAAGAGVMAFSPIDSSRAVLGQIEDARDQVMVITGLPGAINHSTAIPLTGSTRIASVTIAANGTYVIVGTDAGLYVLAGVNTGQLSVVGQGPNRSKGPYSPQYKAADGKYHPLQNITSIGLASGSTFVATLASLTPNASGGGNTGSLVVLPFNEATGLLSAPAVVDNNLPLTAYYQDILTVR